jgi:hypothetical protein
MTIEEKINLIERSAMQLRRAKQNIAADHAMSCLAMLKLCMQQRDEALEAQVSLEKEVDTLTGTGESIIQSKTRVLNANAELMKAGL